MHDRTIHGQPWEPCAACPRRPENGGDGSHGSCCSRRHPAFCTHAAAANAAERGMAEALALPPGASREQAIVAAAHDVARSLPWLDRIRREPAEDRPPPSPAAPAGQKAGRMGAEDVKTGAKRAAPPEQDPEIRAKVEACESRGVRLKSTKCCQTWECKKGHGFEPGRVTWATCGRCKGPGLLEQERARFE